MVIKGQNGHNYEVHELEMNNCAIRCKDATDRRKKHTLGVYGDIKRTCDVFAEIAVQKIGYYEMSQE